MFEVGDYVLFHDEDLGPQHGQILRRFHLMDGNLRWCVFGMKGGHTGDICYQIRWERAYSHELPGSVHHSRLRKISPLERLALA